VSPSVPGGDTRSTLRAAAAVMRSTAERFDAVLADESRPELEVLTELSREVDELERAMATLERELAGLAP
jgi:hypothetical protein